MTEPKMRPLEFRKGRAKVLAWPRQTPHGIRYNFSTCCLYPDKESGKLKEGRSFDLSDLKRLAHAALEADDWYRQQFREAYLEKAQANGPEPEEVSCDEQPDGPDSENESADELDEAAKILEAA